MKIQLVSDIHLDIFPSEAFDNYFVKDFIGSKKDPDVLVLAGDICGSLPKNWKRLQRFLATLSKNFKKILYVPGNHEYYSSELMAGDRILEEVVYPFDNVVLLNNDVITIDGQRFVGSTLWYPETPQAEIMFSSFSDGYAIRRSQEVFPRHYECQAFLKSKVRPGSIVITHHAPSFKSLHEDYRWSDINCFFIVPQEKLIEKTKPRLWLHGHVHNYFHYTLDETEVLCNPYGYFKTAEPLGYHPNEMVTI